MTNTSGGLCRITNSASKNYECNIAIIKVSDEERLQFPNLYYRIVPIDPDKNKEDSSSDESESESESEKDVISEEKSEKKIEKISNDKSRNGTDRKRDVKTYRSFNRKESHREKEYMNHQFRRHSHRNFRDNSNSRANYRRRHSLNNSQSKSPASADFPSPWMQPPNYTPFVNQNFSNHFNSSLEQSFSPNFYPSNETKQQSKGLLGDSPYSPVINHPSNPCQYQHKNLNNFIPDNYQRNEYRQRNFQPPVSDRQTSMKPGQKKMYQHTQRNKFHDNRRFNTKNYKGRGKPNKFNKYA